MKSPLHIAYFIPVLAASLFTVGMPSFIAGSGNVYAASHATQSKTKTIDGLRYKLTLPKPLSLGKQKWMLHVSGNPAATNNLSFEASATMADGMKTRVKVVPKGNGLFELSTALTMSGDWELILIKNKQSKANAKFALTVMGKSHAGHTM
jgi:hypothetical protein